MKRLLPVSLIWAGMLLRAVAQDTDSKPWQNVYWTGSLTLNKSPYRGNGKNIEVTKGCKINIFPGCLVEKAHFMGAGDAAWDIHGSLFRESRFEDALGDRFVAVDTFFENVTMNKTGGWFVDLWSSRWSFGNCVFAGKFMCSKLNATDYSVRALNCTIHDATLPPIVYKRDPSKEAQSAELRFTNCRFVRCEVPESFLAATMDCVFEDCAFSDKREDWAKATKQITVSASIAGKAAPPASYENGMLKITFKPAEAVAGASMSYIYADHHLSVSDYRVPGPFLALGSIDNKPAAKSPPAPAIASAPAPAPPGPVNLQEATAQLVKANRNNLVFVSGSNGSGSGFLAKFGTGVFLFTNAHVAAGVKGAGFKTLQGDQVQVGAPAVAVGHDIFLMQSQAAQPFEVMMGVDENAAIGDDIVVLGNAEGAGVINTITGKIVGLGPNLVEVDAPFKPGNSGSPIIHVKTGKVIGAATYLTIRKFDSATKQPVKEPIVRRFGYRLDSVKTWQPVLWPAFLAQAQEMENVEGLTEDLVKFLDALGDGKISSGVSTNPAIKNRIDAWQAAKSRSLSPRDRQNVDQNFISFLKVTCQADITAARPRMTYDYFQRQLTEQERGRKEIADIFDKIIKDIQTGR